MAKQTPNKRKPLAATKGKPARSPKKSARVSYVPKRDKLGRFKAKKPTKNGAGRTNGKSAFRPKGRTKEKLGSTPRPSTKKLIRPHKPKGKQSTKANIARPPEYEVTSNSERMVTIHTELRKRAIEESRLLVPDARIRKVEDRFGRQALKKEVTVTKFLTESNLEAILRDIQNGLQQIERLAAKKPNVRYTVCLNLSEYGIELYGSDKGVIARVDGLRSEALHYSNWSVPSGTPEEVRTRIELGLEKFLDKKTKTTVCIESATVTALFGELGK